MTNSYWIMFNFGRCLDTNCYGQVHIWYCLDVVFKKHAPMIVFLVQFTILIVPFYVNCRLSNALQKFSTTILIITITPLFHQVTPLEIMTTSNPSMFPFPLFSFIVINWFVPKFNNTSKMLFLFSIRHQVFIPTWEIINAQWIIFIYWCIIASGD